MLRHFVVPLVLTSPSIMAQALETVTSDQRIDGLSLFAKSGHFFTNGDMDGMLCRILNTEHLWPCCQQLLTRKAKTRFKSIFYATAPNFIFNVYKKIKVCSLYLPTVPMKMRNGATHM